MLYLFNPLICLFLIVYCAHHSNFLSDVLKLEQICITKTISWYYFIFVLLKLTLCSCQKLLVICSIGGSTWNAAVLGAGQRLCKKFVVGCESDWTAVLSFLAESTGTKSRDGWSKQPWEKKQRDRYLSAATNLRSLWWEAPPRPVPHHLVSIIWSWGLWVHLWLFSPSIGSRVAESTCLMRW